MSAIESRNGVTIALMKALIRLVMVLMRTWDQGGMRSTPDAGRRGQALARS